MRDPARLLALLGAWAVAREPRDFSIVGDSVLNLINCSHDGLDLDLFARHRRPMQSAVHWVGRWTATRRTRAAEMANARTRCLGDVRELLVKKPRIIAENLGTNDAIQGWPGWRDTFNELIGLMVTRPCVILTNFKIQCQPTSSVWIRRARMLRNKSTP